VDTENITGLLGKAVTVLVGTVEDLLVVALDLGMLGLNPG
jgi:hypothetical protein